EQAVMADMQDFLHAVVATGTRRRDCFDARQDRVGHRLKQWRARRGASGPRRLAAAECEHAPPPALGNWRGGQKIARQIEYVAQIVGMPDAGHSRRYYPRAIRPA